MLHARDKYNDNIIDLRANEGCGSGGIPKEEPVFILRAQDKCAAIAVRAWARANIDQGGDKYLSALALEHAKKMDIWPIKKLAD
jgi:hypothetical protein